MRTCLLLGRLPGAGETLAVVLGPTDPITVNNAYKAAMTSGEYAAIELWSSDAGRRKRKVFAGHSASANSPTLKKSGLEAAANSSSESAQVPAAPEQPGAAGQPEAPSSSGPTIADLGSAETPTLGSQSLRKG